MDLRRRREYSIRIRGWRVAAGLDRRGVASKRARVYLLSGRVKMGFRGGRKPGGGVSASAGIYSSRFYCRRGRGTKVDCSTVGVPTEVLGLRAMPRHLTVHRLIRRRAS